MGDLENIALEIRRKIYTTVCNNKAGHLASSLSSVELLVALFFGGILKYDAKDPEWKDRDRFVLSKGHSALCLYAVLSKAGYFPEEELNTFCKLGTHLGGLPMRGKIPGVEATTGSLGHGVSFAAGIAKYGKTYQQDYMTYVLAGDGELQEGEVWEAVLFSVQNRLDNLVILVDNNKIQATGFTNNILSIEPLGDKFRAFGCETFGVNGHDIKTILETIHICQANKNGKVKVIIADTVKGKGISYIENQGDWHYKMPNTEQMQTGYQELNIIKEGNV